MFKIKSFLKDLQKNKFLCFSFLCNFILIVCNFILIVCCIFLVNYGLEKITTLKEINQEIEETYEEIKREQSEQKEIIANWENTGNVFLEQLITSEIQNYHNLSDIEKVRHIRDWLLQRLPVGHSSYYDLPFLQVLAKNLKHERGVLCGGTGYLFAQVCNRLGFDSVSINFGIPDTADTHVMTLIRIDYEGEPLLILLDAYLGLEFFDQNGHPADFKEIVRSLKDSLEGGTYEKFNYKLHLLSGKKYSIKENIFLSDVFHNNIADIDAFQTTYTSSMEISISKYGYKGSAFSYFLLPLGIGSENGSLYTELIAFYQEELGILIYNLRE